MSMASVFQIWYFPRDYGQIGSSVPGRLHKTLKELERMHIKGPLVFWFSGGGGCL